MFHIRMPESGRGPWEESEYRPMSRLKPLAAAVLIVLFVAYLLGPVGVKLLHEDERAIADRLLSAPAAR